jgi:hypothetical protein
MTACYVPILAATGPVRNARDSQPGLVDLHRRINEDPRRKEWNFDLPIAVTSAVGIALADVSKLG